MYIQIDTTSSVETISATGASLPPSFGACAPSRV